jgi:hypothetical protein
VYGFDELKNEIAIGATTVECPIRGCPRRVARQRKEFLKEERFRCPEHRIVISPSTFEYDREEDNLLCLDATDLALLERIRRVKRESRMARDNSEDAATWNVFRSLEKAGALHRPLTWCTDRPTAGPPRVVYWTCCPDTFGPWAPLIRSALGFGEVLGRYTEPDLVLLWRDLFVFVEAKLGSDNSTYPTDPRNPKSYMTGHGGWFRRVFQEHADFWSVAVKARLYELMRNWLIGTQIAHETGRKFVLVNLVRSESETDIEERFGRHIVQDERRHFRRLTWEQVVNDVAIREAGNRDFDRLVRYFDGKSLGYARWWVRGGEVGVLRRAFGALDPRGLGPDPMREGQ